MKTNNHIIALIYARVSTKKQDPMSQLIRCNEYCQQKGYTVEKTFKDKFTGGGNFLERPAMRELLEYAKKNIHKQFVVVFDDLKRFARDTKFHIDLRTTFSANGLTPECLNYNFDESPEGRFMETIHAAQNELERHQNRRQVIQKQRARLIAGYNAFTSPRGYKKIKHSAHGTIDIPTKKGKWIKKALQKFASGELGTKRQMAIYLQNKEVLGKQDTFRYIQAVSKILKNPFYAGYIEYVPWEVQRRKGKHKALISLDEFNTIQRKLSSNATPKSIRENQNSIFPLRGFINCYYCKTKLTGCKSKGRWGGLYYKYYCWNKKCELRTMQGVIKSVDVKKIHREFDRLLEALKPSKEVLNITKQIFEDVSKEQVKKIAHQALLSTQEKKTKETEIEHLISLISNPNTSELLRERYEKKVTELSLDIEKIARLDSKMPQSEELLRTPRKKMFEVLKNPYKIWTESDLEQKRQLFYFLFEENLEYLPNKGFRTPKKALPIRLFEEFSSADAEYVHLLRRSSNPIQAYIKKWNSQISTMLEHQNQ